MLTVRNFEIEKANGQGAFMVLLNSRDLPISISFKLAKMKKVVDGILDTYLERKNAILLKWCEKDDNDKPIIKDRKYSVKANIQEYTADLKELLNQESELGIDRIKIKFTDLPDKLLSANDFEALEPFIEFTEK